MTPSGYALRFISGKYEGGVYQLPDEQEIVIGRGGELDLVLVEDMVSRKHAKITTGSGKIIIQDLGSTNGTFVNGEKIKRAPLRDGDRVLIGTSILKVVPADGDINAGAADLQRAADENQRRRAEQGADTAMSGSLSDVAVPDLLQLFTTSRKTGVLSVTNTEDAGRVYIREGQIYYAEYNGIEDMDPLKALTRMMGWDDGEFRMGPPSDQVFDFEIGEPSDHVIIEAARQLDEFRRLADDLPELEDMVKVPRPLSPSLAELSAEELEVFQLALNHEFFQPILDGSPYSDLQTGTLVKGLLDRGYLRIG